MFFIQLCLVASFFASNCWAHVGLTFPPARQYDLDFLDNVRTRPPCGMPKGKLCFPFSFDASLSKVIKDITIKGLWDDCVDSHLSTFMNSPGLFWMRIYAQKNSCSRSHKSQKTVFSMSNLKLKSFCDFDFWITRLNSQLCKKNVYPF